MIMEDERRAVVDTCLLMQRQGLVVGTAGNVSIRTADLIAISPSGVPYEEMAPEDVVVVGTDGARVDGDLEPSSELPLHLSVYRATDAGALTHNHAPASTALGLVVDEIPPSHYYSVMFGGAIRVAPYAGFGTDELAANVTEALRDRTGALMKNHGAITIGPTVAKAVGMLPILEYVCEVHLRAMASGAPIALLSDAPRARDPLMEEANSTVARTLPSRERSPRLIGLKKASGRSSGASAIRTTRYS